MRALLPIILLGILTTPALALPAAAQQVPNPMQKDGSNASMLTMTASEGDMRGFLPPSFGGNWLAGQFFKSLDTVGHPSNTKMTTNIHREAIGSGAFGPASADMALMVTAGKTNAQTSLVEGELAGMWIVTEQGRKGDTGGLIVSSSKFKSFTADDSGGITTLEVAGIWKDVNNNVIWEVHTLPSFGVGLGADVSNGGGYGIMLGNNGPSAAGAANMIMPYSGVMVQNADYANQCPTHCSMWENVITATSQQLADRGSIFFQVAAGPAATGDIMIGSGFNATKAEVPTQSLGYRIVLKNINGAFTVTNGPGEIAKEIITSHCPTCGTAERLTGRFIQSEWRDTGTSLTAGGSHRLAFAGGQAIWQINTAAAGDYGTAISPLVIYPSGGIGVAAVSGGDPGYGNMNSSWYKVGGIPGVSCAAGVPTALFKIDGGIVTHC